MEGFRADVASRSRPERILVCVGPAPSSARLIRAAADLARRLECPWIAAHVGLGAALGLREQARVDGHLALAEELGAEVARLTGRRTAPALAAFARARGATRIVVGKPRHPRWRDRLEGSLLDELVRRSGDVELHVVTGVDGPPASSRPPPGARGAPLRDVAAAAGLVGAATATARFASPVLSDADVVMTFLLVIVFSAYRLGRAGAWAAPLLSVAAYNFFFVPPFHTFAVADTRNLLTFAVLLGVGLAVSSLADRLRRQESDAVAREQRTAALLALTRAVAAAPDEEAVAAVIVREAATRLAVGAVLVVAEPSGLRRVAGAGEDADARVMEVAAATSSAGAVATQDTLRGVPVIEGGAVIAVLVLVQPAAGVTDLADAYARQAALALARARHARSAEEASLRARAEELRSALLSTVSHDLRTPLATITGAATALLEGGPRLAEPARAELLTSVRDEADRLERLVANLLEMTRLVSGSLRVRREWVPLEEIVGAAFRRVERALRGHDVAIDLPADLPLLEVDPILFEVVLANLLENAARHTGSGAAVTLAAHMVAGAVEVEVRDRGAGLPPGDPARLFEPFVQGVPGSAGTGLGLAICRGIVRAHGGEIRARPAAGGGASFVLTLPTRGEPPAVPLESAVGA